MSTPDIRTTLLEIIAEEDKRFQQEHSTGSIQANTILSEANRQLGQYRSVDFEQAILTCWYDLFRNGILAWGYNLSNPDPPFCHVTAHGRRVLENLSRDPSNPEGYMAFLSSNTNLNPIAKSYIKEALRTYNTNCVKASAVMVGAATESLVLLIQDTLISRMDSLGLSKPRDLSDWRMKKVVTAIENIIKQKKSIMPNDLYESFEAYWPAFTHQIRTARNESGHPSSIAPVTQDTVHASLLIFPELGILVDRLKDWIDNFFA